MVTFIASGFESKSENVLLKLSKVLMKIHLEYCIYVWSLYLGKYILLWWVCSKN